MECPYSSVCLNADQCYRCSDARLLKLPKKVKGLSARRGASLWRRMEYDISKSLQRAGVAARPQPASGNKWFAPGDVISPEYLIECKTHTISAAGAKQHTISRKHLEKIAEEAAMLGRLPIYVFKFKNDDKSYAVVDFDILLELFERTRSGDQ